MARPQQSTIKNDPFEEADPVSLIVGGKSKKPREEAERNAEEAKSAPVAKTPTTGRASHKKEKLTVHLTHDLIERVKNAAYWNPRLTIASIAERGIVAVIEEIERENGKPYPPREEELKGGRPIGSRAASG